jgi:hypothetical protein
MPFNASNQGNTYFNTRKPSLHSAKHLQAQIAPLVMRESQGSTTVLLTHASTKKGGGLL